MPPPSPPSAWDDDFANTPPQGQQRQDQQQQTRSSRRAAHTQAQRTLWARADDPNAMPFHLLQQQSHAPSQPSAPAQFVPAMQVLSRKPPKPSSASATTHPSSAHARTGSGKVLALRPSSIPPRPNTSSSTSNTTPHSTSTAVPVTASTPVSANASANPHTSAIPSASGLAQQEEEYDSEEEEARLAAERAFAARVENAARERADKARRYAEVRERLFGPADGGGASGASSPGTSSPRDSPGPGARRGRGDGVRGDARGRGEMRSRESSGRGRGRGRGERGARGAGSRGGETHSRTASRGDEWSSGLGDGGRGSLDVRRGEASEASTSGGGRSGARPESPVERTSRGTGQLYDPLEGSGSSSRPVREGTPRREGMPVRMPRGPDGGRGFAARGRGG